MPKAKGQNVLTVDFVNYPEPKDLMIRGQEFYAVWDENAGIWKTDRASLYKIIDDTINTVRDKHKDCSIALCRRASDKVVERLNDYIKRNLYDIYNDLNQKLVFKSDPVCREDYSTKRLDYDVVEGECPCWNEIIGTLYDDAERHKIEWCIGSIVSGDSKTLQKFLVFYGSAGTGKSTILNIIAKLFKGYTANFDAKSLGANKDFALEQFSTNPLVAIQHDGDLSHIADNTKLNSLVSHEEMSVNEKYKKLYSTKFNAFLFMGTNSPVKITDQKSGLLRRLIDCKPSGRKLSSSDYNRCMKGVDFELGQIAYHCLEVYESNKHCYDDYRPLEMISITNEFYNFVNDNLAILDVPEVSLRSAYNTYKQYAESGNMENVMSLTKFREELKNYYHTYENNKFYNLNKEVFYNKERIRNASSEEPLPDWLLFKNQSSIFDVEFMDCPAQYSTEDGKPKMAWDNVSTTLGELDTFKQHYVKTPLNLIVIDLDMKDKKGEKCKYLNLKRAAEFPPTYAELSKSGEGVHLHYYYDGDPLELADVIEKDVEIKVYSGKQALRRRLTMCNDNEIMHISSGLPTRKEKKKDMIDMYHFENEKHIRNMVIKCLSKADGRSTTQNMQHIKKIIEDAHENADLYYDLSDMYDDIYSFAASSSNQSDNCLKIVDEISDKLKKVPDIEVLHVPDEDSDTPIVFYDVEVFQNLFVICWGFDDDSDVVAMINPSPDEVLKLFRYRIIGFNNKEYDNTICMARAQGYTLMELYKLSQDIISNRVKPWWDAKRASYTDILDFASKKQSLKKYEIEMGIDHDELGLDWNKPVPEEMWERVAEYCKHDVVATRKAFHYLEGDWTGREILAELSGLTVNDSNNDHSKAIIFQGNKTPDLVYTDLATGEQFYDGEPYISTRTAEINSFPGYEYVWDAKENKYKNMYRDWDMSFGGLVWSKPGYYENVYLLDIESMHPTSIKQLDLFGKYNKGFVDIMDLRLAIKHKDYEYLKTAFDGRVAKYLDDKKKFKALKQAIKMVINPVYGLTSASFPNPFKDPRNVNNIVALRGALFMKTLFDEVVAMGYEPIHIKTDSIKIANGDEKIKQFCMDFAEKYGYRFEHEATYDKICLVNKAVYIAHESYGEDAEDGHPWVATGAQFAVPYVYKTLFSREEITFEDCCQTFQVRVGALHLDKNELLPSVVEEEKQRDKLNTAIKKLEKSGDTEDPTYETLVRTRTSLGEKIKEGHEYQFIGRVGQFTPIKDGRKGGKLMVVKSQEDVDAGIEKPSSASGADGYRWLESMTVKKLGLEDAIDTSYFDRLVDEAIDEIEKYVDIETLCGYARRKSA